jgi:hypothetical protein
LRAYANAETGQSDAQAVQTMYQYAGKQNHVERQNVR